MLTSGPYTLALNSPVAPQPPSAGIRFVDLVLANQSPFICAVKLSVSGAAATLQPYQAMLYPLAPGDLPTVTPTTNTSQGDTITTGYLSADWYLPTDRVAGTYPAPLVSQSVSVTGSVDLGAGAVVELATGTTVTADLAAGASVALAAGSTVELASGTTVTADLAAGASINVGGGTVQVENTAGGVIQTYAKTPPAIGNLGGTLSAGQISGASPYQMAFVNIGGPAPGNLLLVIVTLEADNFGWPAGTYTITPPSAAWSSDHQSLTVPAQSGSGACMTWLFWTIYDGSVGATPWTLTFPAGYSSGASCYAQSLFFGSGSVNQFSNPALTGAASGPTSWTAGGASNPNLNLSSAGLWVATVAVTSSTAPTFSLGIEYTGTFTNEPPGTAPTYNTYRAGLWVASSQTGSLFVDSSANPQDLTNYPTVYGQTGLVIPQ